MNLRSWGGGGKEKKSIEYIQFTDAEYARSLEQEEARNVTEPIVPNLSEIMDMDMALAIYKNDLVIAKRFENFETSNK